MTQEEKVDINQKISQEKDNTILQNELLSKLINTPPNLSIKYENEELNKFKDEILLYLNERNNHFLTLIKYFQDKMNQTREEYTSQLNLIHQNYEAILSSQASIINKIDKYSNFELFMNKTNDQMITHEIRINNLSQDFIKAVQKYDKIYLDNLELPGYIGKFAKFKNCQAFFDFIIREIDKMNLYKEKNNLDLKNNKDRLDNTIKTFNLLFKNNNEAQMKYIKQINEKNFKECKDMNEALSNRVCDLRIENAKYSIDLIKKSEELGKDWNKILTIKDEMLEMVNEKINGFRKVFNGNTTLFNEFRKEYEEFKVKINEIFNYFKEMKTINENNNNNQVINNHNNPCTNYTGCYINSALPSEKKSFKHFSKFTKRAKSKNAKHFDKKAFIKSYMTINGNKNISENIIINNNKENNNASSNGLIHIECMSKEKRNKIFQNENHLKKSAYTTCREPRSSKSVTKIEINSLNKVYTSKEEFKTNNLLNSLKNDINTNKSENISKNDNTDNNNKSENKNDNINDKNNKSDNIDNSNIYNEDENIQIKVNEEENKTEEMNNNNSNNYNQSEMNLPGKIKSNNESNRDSLKNMNKESEKILIKINKKARKSFAPSSKSIISFESENNNNLCDISNITGTHKTEDLNMMNYSLYSTNSFNSNTNTNKYILNDNNNIIEQNSQVIKELASELEQSTNKKEILNSNKKKIEESFKINRSRISKLNLTKNNNIINNNMDITNSTEKTDDINKLQSNNNNNTNMNKNINISISSNTNNKNINPNSDNVNVNANINTMNKKMDLFDKKLFNLEILLKEKIIEILNQMEKIQNFFKLSFNNKIQITSRTKNPSFTSNKETNFNFNNFNINTTPNINLGKNEISYDYISNTNNINNLNKRNSQDDYFVGCSVKRLAPIIEIDVNNLQFSPSPNRTQYKVFSSRRKEGRNKFNKNGLTTNFKDIKLKRNENKENLKPNNTNIDGLNSNGNNNGTQIRIFGKGGNLTGTGVNKWINLNKLINYDKPIKENISNTALI